MIGLSSSRFMIIIEINYQYQTMIHFLKKRWIEVIRFDVRSIFHQNHDMPAPGSGIYNNVW